MDQEQKRFSERVPVTYETTQRLTRYAEMLSVWNERMNLVSASTIPQVWTRHFLDSAQLMEHIPAGAATLADMGAGAGFPGLVLAILAKEKGSAPKVIEIESTGKKADFLQAVIDELQLNAIVRRERVEDIKDLKADVVVARGLKPLPELLKYAARLTHKGTVCLFLKGKSLPEELTQAKKCWTFAAKEYQSLSDDTGRILRIENLQYSPRGHLRSR